MWLWIAWAIFGVASSEAPCPADPVLELSESSDQALAAYDMPDESALRRAESGIVDGLRCLRAPIDRALAARVHRAQALIYFEAQRPAEVRRAWAAARIVDPAVEPDPRRFPPSHPMWRLWEEATAVSDHRRRFKLVPPGGWLVDGREEAEFPTDRAFIVQARGKPRGALPGEVRDSAYCVSIGDVPTYTYLQPDPVVRAERRRRVRKGGTIASAVLLAGAAGSMGLALIDRHAVLNDPQYANIDRRAVRANTEANVAVGLAAGSLTTFVAAWTVKW